MSRLWLLFDHNERYFAGERSSSTSLPAVIRAVNASNETPDDVIMVGISGDFPKALYAQSTGLEARRPAALDVRFAYSWQEEDQVVVFVHKTDFANRAGFEALRLGQLKPQVRFILAVTVSGSGLIDPPCLVGNGRVPVFFFASPLKELAEVDGKTFSNMINLADHILGRLPPGGGAVELATLLNHDDWRQPENAAAARLLNVNVDDPCLLYILAALVNGCHWANARRLLVEPGLRPTHEWIGGGSATPEEVWKGMAAEIKQRAGWPIPRAFLQILPHGGEPPLSGEQMRGMLGEWFSDREQGACCRGVSEETWRELRTQAMERLGK